MAEALKLKAGISRAFEIPNPAEVHPELRVLLKRRESLRIRINELEDEYSRESARLIEQSHAGRGRAALAASLADGVDPATAMNKRESVPSIGAIYDELEATKAAIELLDGKIRNARGAASATIRPMIEGEHRRLVQEMAGAFMALNETWRNYRLFVDELNRRQIAWSMLGPMHPNFLGEPDSKDSVVGMWLNEAVRQRFIDRSRLPEKMR